MEIERARLTRKLAAIKESQGNISGTFHFQAFSCSHCFLFLRFESIETEFF